MNCLSISLSLTHTHNLLLLNYVKNVPNFKNHKWKSRVGLMWLVWYGNQSLRWGSCNRKQTKTYTHTHTHLFKFSSSRCVRDDDTIYNNNLHYVTFSTYRQRTVSIQTDDTIRLWCYEMVLLTLAPLWLLSVEHSVHLTGFFLSTFLLLLLASFSLHLWYLWPLRSLLWWDPHPFYLLLFLLIISLTPLKWCIFRMRTHTSFALILKNLFIF